MLPTYMTRHCLENGKLQQVLADYQPEELKIYILYASRKHQLPAVRALIDYLEAWFRVNPWKGLDKT